MVILRTVILIIFILPSLLSATNFYVGNDGDNSNDGKSAVNAMQTLEVAVDSLTAGDTLYIMGGTWNESHSTSGITDFETWYSMLLLYNINGTASNPIVITAYPDSAQPQLWGDGGVDSSWTRWGIVIHSSTHIVINNLRMTHAICGVVLRNSDSCTISYCQIDTNYLGGYPQDNGGGIYIAGGHEGQNLECRGLLIEHNHIFNNDLTIATYPSTTGHHNAGGIHCYSLFNSIIRGNTIHGLYWGRGIAFKVLSDSNLVDSNEVYDGAEGITQETGSDADTIRFNIIHDVEIGITHTDQGDNGTTYRLIAYNNTIYNTSKRGISFGYGSGDGGSGTQNTTIFNNIVYDCVENGSGYAPFMVYNQTHTFDLSDYNSWYGETIADTDVVYWKGSGLTLAEHVTANNLDSNSIWDDPEFLSTDTSSEYYLDIDYASPCATTGRGGVWPTYMGANEPILYVDWINDKTEWSDTVWLTSDSLPYYCTGDDTLILIAVDSTEITSATDGIVIAGGNNICIDFGNNILKYGIDGDHNHNAVRVEDTVANSHHIIIRRMTITHDIDSATADSVYNCDGIAVWDVDSMRIDSVNINTEGHHMSCVDGLNRNYYGSGTPATRELQAAADGVSNLWITNSVFNNNAHSQDFRTNVQNAAVRVKTKSLSAGDFTIRMVHDTVTSNHSCFRALYNSDNGQRCLIEIDSNKFIVDSRSRLCAWDEDFCNSLGDPFAIDIYGITGGSYISNNFITADSSSFNSYGGNGIILQGSRGTVTDTVKIINNIIHAFFGQDAGGTEGSQKAIALYFRADQGAGFNYNQYNLVQNNHLYGYGDNDENTLHFSEKIETGRILIDSGFHNNSFINNRWYCLQVDSLVDTATATRYACAIAGMDDARVNRTTDINGDCYDDSLNLFYGNYYYVNDEDSHPFEGGVYAAWQFGFGGQTLINETFYRPSGGDKSAVFFGVTGSAYASSIGSKLVDCVFQGDVEDTVKWNTISTADDGRGKDLQFARVVDLLIIDIDSIPISGATIAIRNAYNQTVSSGSSDASGLYQDTITYLHYHYNAPVCADSGKCWDDSTGYSPAWGIASYNGMIDSVQITVDATSECYGIVQLLESEPPTYYFIGKK